ncbi:hypothetical protein DFH06DRAFT_603319 [Mycena polygramma]|nr:hypothetical protein DFH06DRAFT_603319 [Mycena polygramma]
MDFAARRFLAPITSATRPARFPPSTLTPSLSSLACGLQAKATARVVAIRTEVVRVCVCRRSPTRMDCYRPSDSVCRPPRYSRYDRLLYRVQQPPFGFVFATIDIHLHFGFWLDRSLALHVRPARLPPSPRHYRPSRSHTASGRGHKLPRGWQVTRKEVIRVCVWARPAVGVAVVVAWLGPRGHAFMSVRSTYTTANGLSLLRKGQESACSRRASSFVLRAPYASPTYRPGVPGRITFASPDR